jgi:hypothetical protein
MGGGRQPSPLSRLRSLGYSAEAVDRVADLARGRFEVPADILRVLDNFAYEHDWADAYEIRSAQASLLRPRIMCINAAILSYALAEAFPQLHRQLIALHRRGPDGVECGHVVTAYWQDGGRLGAFSKSNYPVLDHRPQRFTTLEAVAVSYARGYLSMSFTPLYFGLPRLDDLPGVDWRLGDAPLTPYLDHFKNSYEYAFELEQPREGTSP